MHRIRELPDEADHIDVMNSIGTPGVSGSLKKAKNPNIERPSASKHASSYADYEYT